jgi:hypothetical protein
MTMRATLSLPLIVILAVACGESEMNAQRSQDRNSKPAPPTTATSPEGGVVLAFDLPDEFRAEPAGSPRAVTGFRVGYFRASDPKAIRTMDFARDAVAVQGQTAQVTLPRESGCGVDCRVRVQTLSAGQVSAWSDPVPLQTSAASSSPPKPQAAEPARQARPERPRAASPEQRRAGLALSDIEPYQELSKELRALLPSDTNIETEVRRFRRLEDLALAVAISRQYIVPFVTLSRAIEGPPRLTPRNALARLRQDLDPRAVRKVRPEATKLLTRNSDPHVAR